MIRLHAAARTDTGHVRSANQDAWLVVDHHLYAVADGMGGHRGGEVASSTIVDTLRDRFTATTAPLDPDAVEQAIGAANAAILDRAATDPELAGMGSTLVCLSVGIDPDGTDLLTIHNIGDSRAYRLRTGELDPLTDDHSLVAEMVRDGRLTADEARVHRSRSVLTRAMGMDGHPELDRVDVTPIAGDRFLLCSDGLHGEVTDADIAAVLRRIADPAAAADELVRIALDAGGRDNVTVIVLDITDDGDASLAASRRITRTAASTRSERIDTSDGAGIAGASATTGTPHDRAGTGDVGAVRTTRLVTPRVVAFIALLTALAVVVAWALVNAPDSDPEPGIVVVPVVTTTIDPFSAEAPDALLELGTTLPGAGAIAPPGVVITSIVTVPVGVTTTLLRLPLPAPGAQKSTAQRSAAQASAAQASAAQAPTTQVQRPQIPVRRVPARPPTTRTATAR